MNITWENFNNLTEDNVSRNVSNSSGVYLIWVKLNNNKWRCIYVGIAEYLSDRLSNHLSKTEPNLKLRKHVQEHICGFEYVLVARKSDREGIERFLYDTYKKPECNEIEPIGMPLQVNLP